MWRASVLAFSGAVILVLAGWALHRKSTPADILFEPVVPNIESAPLCPWREPEADMRAFFPAATRYTNETRILSGIRVELRAMLGRMPESEENALVLHTIFSGADQIGCVITRRVKGEHGAIELAVAINQQGEIGGFRLQRMREPEEIANALGSDAWKSRFRGRTHDRGWAENDATNLPPAARVSADAIREGLRSVLILHAASERLVRQGGSKSKSTNVAAGV